MSGWSSASESSISAVKEHHFAVGRDDLLADGIIRIIRVDQGDKVRGDIHAEEPVGAERFALGLGQRDDLFDLFRRVQAVAQLPAPVVPLFIGNVGESRGTFGREGDRSFFTPKLNCKR